MNAAIDSGTWWQQIKQNDDRFIDWLKKQYHGEITAHKRILAFIDAFAPIEERWVLVLQIIANQELRHAKWVGKLLHTRGFTPALLEKEERCWDQTLGGIDSFESGAAVASHAERMRLERIRAITENEDAPEDVREVFLQILPEEVFHEKAFRKMAGEDAMTRALENHLAGRAAIGLIPEAMV